MPIHEFRCPAGHRTEQFFRKISDAVAQTTCTVCGATAERQMSGSGLVFKGSGFYLTDYGKSGSAAAKAKSEAGGSEGRSDAKSEGPAESKSSGSESKSDGAISTTVTKESKPAPAPAAPASSEGSRKKSSKSAPKAE